MPAIVPVITDQVLYQQVTTLDGVDFVLTFALNLRDSYWYVDVADQDGVPIATGIKIVVNWDLLRRCIDERRPKGQLIAIDTTGQGLDPGPDDFGTRVQLLYLSEAEVQANA